MYGEDGELRKGSAAPSATDSTGQPGSARERERQRERERETTSHRVFTASPTGTGRTGCQRGAVMRPGCALGVLSAANNRGQTW